MKYLSLIGALSAAFCLSAPGRVAQDSQAPPPEMPQGFAEMMEKAEHYRAPGEHHALLERFLGEWETETSVMMGGERTPAEQGTAVGSWLMEGRWLRLDSTGHMLGMPIDSFWVMGYDNFKMSYVATAVSTMDTAMNRAEGDLDPGGKALILYGTIDEYLTGEHDKMVKVVYRLVSDDEIVMELHDLAIGLKNTQVVETRYHRKD